MEFPSTVSFAQAARVLTRAAERRALATPSFRCPPRLVGVDRTIRRRSEREGDSVVSIRVRGRPQEAVVSDMIEGIVVCNGLASPQADRVRNELWAIWTRAEETAVRGAA
jgi:hypothetical protein